MTQLKRIWFAMAGALLLFASTHASAALITYDFYKLTDNNVEDLSGQLSISLWDAAMANSQFGLSLASDEVLFTVMNDVGIASNIAEIYFDDGLLGPSSAINSLGGFTDFEGADMSGTSPPNLPGGAGAEPPFEATVLLSVDVNPGPPSKGVDQAEDILGIKLGAGDLVDFDGIVAAVADGSLRFGLHVRSIGVAGGSDSYVNNLPGPVDPDPPPGVPAPGTLLLLGLGLVGLARTRWKRRPPG